MAKYFELPAPKEAVNSNLTYDSAQEILKTKLSESVQLRMISDVPLGAFLSGGIDSSIIVSQATKFTSKLNTFSIGFADNSYFDETQFSNILLI